MRVCCCCWAAGESTILMLLLLYQAGWGRGWCCVSGGCARRGVSTRSRNLRRWSSDTTVPHPDFSLQKTDECREAVMIIRQARAENRVPGLGGKEEDECGDGAGLPMPISTR